MVVKDDLPLVTWLYQQLEIDDLNKKVKILSETVDHYAKLDNYNHVMITPNPEDDGAYVYYGKDHPCDKAREAKEKIKELDKNKG